MEKQLLIVGIDPGTTIGYSILNIDGSLIKVDSSKQLNLSLLINEIMKHGKVVIVASDVSPPSNFVSLFASKFGAKLIHPREDMKVKEKKELTQNYEFKNRHERDSLASALFAHKESFSLLNKLNNFITKNNKQEIANELKEIVIKKGLSIRESLNIIENKSFIETKKYQPRVDIKQELNSRLLNLEKENISLKNKNNDLLRKINYLLKEKNNLSKKINNKNWDRKIENLFYFKDQRIQNLSKEVQLQKQQINLLNNKISLMNGFILSLSNKVLVKKLNNLGSKEFYEKNKLLRIKHGDILLIENTSIISDNVINEIKDLVTYIIYKNNHNKLLEDNFYLINNSKLKLLEIEDFALAEKDEFEKIIKNKDVLNRILKQYKNERNT